MKTRKWARMGFSVTHYIDLTVCHQHAPFFLQSGHDCWWIGQRSGSVSCRKVARKIIKCRMNPGITLKEEAINLNSSFSDRGWRFLKRHLPWGSVFPFTRNDLPWLNDFTSLQPLSPSLLHFPSVFPVLKICVLTDWFLYNFTPYRLSALSFFASLKVFFKKALLNKE